MNTPNQKVTENDLTDFPPLSDPQNTTQINSPVPLIRTTPLALTPVTQAFILGNLAEPALQQTMDSKSHIMDPGWFRTMVQGGLIDVSHELSQMTQLSSMTFRPKKEQVEQMRDLLQQWTGRALAMTSFIKNIDYQRIDVPARIGKSHTNPIGDATQKACIAVFGATDEFKQQFIEGAARIRESHEQLTTHPLFISIMRQASLARPTLHTLASIQPEQPSLLQKPLVVMSRWLTAACILDLPDEVHAFAKACPQAIRQTFDLDVLDHRLYRHTQRNTIGQEGYPDVPGGGQIPPTLKINAFFAALQLSRTACMDALHEANPAIMLNMGHWIKNGKSTQFSLATLHRYFIPGCDPHAFKHAIDLASAPMINPPAFHAGVDAYIQESFELQALPKLQKDLLDQAIDMLSIEKPLLHPYIESHLQAGTYDQDPCLAVSEALSKGMPNVIDHFRGRMPWSELETTYPHSSPVFSVLCAMHTAMNDETIDEDEKPYEAAILSLIERAAEDGKTDFVMKTFAYSTAFINRPSGAHVVQEPLAMLSVKGLTNVIVKFLENGLNPHARISENVPSVLETADIENPGVAHLIRTFLNRQKIHGLLDDMEPIVPKPESGKMGAGR